MQVWKKQTTKWVANGRTVPPKTKRAKRVVIESKRFYGTLTLSNGKRKQIPLTEERDTAETLLRRLQTQEDSKRANGADRYHDDRQRPLTEFLTDYISYLTAKGNAERYIHGVKLRLTKLLAALKWRTIPDIDAGRLTRLLADWRSRKERSMSITTANDYLIACKGFTRWLWTERRTPDDPLAGQRRMNADTDLRHVRRPLTADELTLLTTTTHTSKKSYRGDDWQLTPSDRRMLYLLASYTGLRASELASLSVSSFDFDQRTFTVEASYAKNRKRTTLPIHPFLIGILPEWFASLGRDKLFPGSWAVRCFAGRIMQRDLARAGIASRDSQGRVIDFHSLRYTFITALARAGVHPSKAQRLARHSTISLTMDVYTALDIDDLRDALGSLPEPEPKPTTT